MDNIEQAIIKTIQTIEEKRNDLVETKIAAVEAEQAYKSKKHRNMLIADSELRDEVTYSGKITESIREAYVENECGNERYNWKVAETLSLALTEQLKALYAELSGYQSLLKERQSDREFTNMKHN